MTATLFDFDGVLVDSEPVHLAAFNDVLAPFGVTIDEEAYAESYLSLDDAGVFREVLTRRAGRAPDEREVRALVQAKAPRFLERFAAGFRVFPGAAEVVARRAARGIVGIVSGALETEIAFAMGKMSISEAVSFVVSAERTTAGKPHPAPYLLALEELRGLGHAAGVVVVEDSLGGVASAKAAGLRCVGVAHTYTAPELTEAGADAVVADLASLTDALLEAGE
ncbi:MAG TPA: HAD family phosphatase [Polyangiaceae bacterium]